MMCCFFLSIAQSLLSPGLPFLLAGGSFALSKWKLQHDLETKVMIVVTFKLALKFYIAELHGLCETFGTRRLER